jgi:ribulose-phosphate 3-epimerase
VEGSVPQSSKLFSGEDSSTSLGMTNKFMRIPNKLHREIIPSPGTNNATWDDMRQKLDMVKPFAKVIHIDLLDGKFAPNTTLLDAAPFAPYAKDIIFEAHLMVEHPAQYLEAFADAGFKRFIGQIEQMPDINEFIAKAESLGEVGLGVDTQTPVDAIFPYLEDIDFGFVMTVKAGFSRQSFMPEMLEKVKKLKEMDPLLPIEVDGGIKDSTIVAAREAGATRYVSTGFIFDAPKPEEGYHTLCELVK